MDSCYSCCCAFNSSCKCYRASYSCDKCRVFWIHFTVPLSCPFIMKVLWWLQSQQLGTQYLKCRAQHWECQVGDKKVDNTCHGNSLDLVSTLCRMNEIKFKKWRRNICSFSYVPLCRLNLIKFKKIAGGIFVPIPIQNCTYSTVYYS